VSPELIAEHAQQLMFNFEGVDRRQFNEMLKKRFLEALTEAGHELPPTDEDVSQQLELVIVRNPKLVREAYKCIRSERLTAREVMLSPVLESEVDLQRAAKNIYGVFPSDMGPSEKDFAEMLDTAEEVLWWHRNPVRKPTSVALFGWHDGIGFFPDFIVGVAGRTQGDGVALTELKGPQLREYDRLKAGATHLRYGRVFMVGRETLAPEVHLGCGAWWATRLSMMAHLRFNACGLTEQDITYRKRGPTRCALPYAQYACYPALSSSLSTLRNVASSTGAAPAA
jgi:hypothetical protein